MSLNEEQSFKGHILTETILNSGVAADAAIDFSDYMVKLDMDRADPIIRMTLHDTTDGGTTAEIEYTPNDRLALADVATLASGEYVITDEDTINIGDATNTGGRTYRLNISYWSGRKYNL